MSDYKNILLINFGGIGDEILFLPVIQSLKNKYPSSKVTLCLEKRSSAFINLTDLIDDCFFIDIKTKNKYIEMLKLYFKALTGRYELVISSGSNPLIPVLLYFTGIKTRIAYSSSALSRRLLTYPVELNTNQYASKMYFDLVKPVTNEEFMLPSVSIPEFERKENSVLIHPGVSKISVSKNIIKIFKPEIWAELIKLILKTGKNVYLAGGPDDEKCISAIKENLKDTDLTNFHDLYGTTKNIYDLAKLIKSVDVMICSDSGPMHIGVAVNTKTIAIFGPTNEKKLFPQNEKFIAVTNEADCRPCLWDKRQTTCSELKCLDINISEILDYIK